MELRVQICVCLANPTQVLTEKGKEKEGESTANINEEENEVEDAGEIDDNPIYGSDEYSGFVDATSDDQIPIPKKKERQNSVKPAKKMSKREAESNTDILI